MATVDALLVTLYVSKGRPPGHIAHAAEILRTLHLNVRSAAFGEVHVLYEGAGDDDCAEVRTLVLPVPLVCTPVAAQPDVAALFRYAARALGGRLVLLANPDTVVEGLKRLQPSLFSMRDLAVLTVRPPPPHLLRHTLGPSEASATSPNGSLAARVAACMERLDNRCDPRSRKLRPPDSFDAYLFRHVKRRPCACHSLWRGRGLRGEAPRMLMIGRMSAKGRDRVGSELPGRRSVHPTRAGRSRGCISRSTPGSPTRTRCSRSSRWATSRATCALRKAPCEDGPNGVGWIHKGGHTEVQSKGGGPRGWVQMGRSRGGGGGG